MWLLYISCAWIAGVFSGSKVGFPFAIIFSSFLPFLLIPLLPDNKKKLAAIALCLLVFCGGNIHFLSSQPQIDKHFLCFYNDGGTVEIQGMVAYDPDVRVKFCLLKLSASEINVDGVGKEVSGTALVRVPRYPAYHYGDVLQLTGKLETPVPFDDFNYKSYLAQQEIYSIIYYPKIEILERGKGFNPLQWLHSIRESLSSTLARALPEPHSSLAQGILLGIRNNIPDPLSQAFSRTGTAHLLAISGLHLSIIIGVALSLGILVFGRQYHTYIWIALLVTWLYTLLSGMRPPVIRAAIMGSLFLMAEFLGRQRSAITALALAAAVMVGVKPQILWSVSFQLSFLAITGLVFLFPHFQKWGRKGVTALFGDREAIANIGNMVSDSFALTLAAMIPIWPLIACNFCVLSLVALPATFFSLPALPAIIATTTLVAFTGLLAPIAAQILGWVDWLFLSYLLLVIHGFDALRFSSLELNTFPHWQIWGYYIVLAVEMALLNHRK